MPGDMDVRDFLESLPDRVQKEALEGADTVFHFDIRDEGHGIRKTVSVADASIKVQEGLVGEPKCVVTASSEDLAAVLTGKLNPMMALMTGRIKISNSAEMLKYARLFGLM